MPPKQKITKEQITHAAYLIVKEEGVSNLSARELAKKLNCTTTPIYTYYKNMDEIKNAVYDITKNEGVEYLSESLNYFPVFKEFGLRWIRFFVENRNLYEFIDSRVEKGMPYGLFNEDFKPILAEIKKSIEHAFGLDDKYATEMLTQMMIFSCGITSLLNRKIGKLDMDEISRLTSETCIGLVAGYKTKCGSYNAEEIKKMMDSVTNAPKKVK